jgi:hypothetical protein
MAEKVLSQDERMEVFRALVEAQDREMTVPQSREATARQFGVSEEQVRRIERAVRRQRGAGPPH